MAEEHDIRAKLTLDDAAGAALEHIKGGFEHVGEKAREVQHELGAMLKQTLAVAAGFQLSGAIDSVKELGHEIFAAATANEDQVKSIAGLIAMTDKSGMSFDETREKAAVLKEELVDIGTKAGVSTDQMIDAFETIAVRSQKSADEIKEMTNQMAIAGRALPGGVQTLAAAYRDLETGIVRPRNAIVQLIRQTGTAHGSARDIAKSLSQMVQTGHMDKAFDLAGIAIGKMSDKMKTVPLTFGEAVKGLKNIRENIYESLGLPLLNAITPQLERLKGYLTDHREAIIEFAKTATEKVGVWVTWSANKIAEGFHYIQAHAEQIEHAFTRGAKMVKDAFEFILAHKDGIALAMGAKTGANLGMGLVGPGMGAVAKAAAGTGGSAMGAEGGVLAALGPELAYALPLVIGAMLGLGGAFDNLMNDTAAFHASSLKVWASIQSDFGATIGELHADFVDLMPAIRTVADFAGMELLLSIKEVSMVLRSFSDVIKIAREAVGGLAKKLGYDVPKMTADEQVKIVRNFEAPSTLAALAAGVAKRSERTVAAPPVMNFTGPISIKQDFRDQDPDRVAVIFRNDLAKNATNRLGARTQGPLGVGTM